MTQEEAFQQAVSALFEGPLAGSKAPADPFAYTPGMVTTGQAGGLFGLLAGFAAKGLGLTATGLNGAPDQPIFRTSFNWQQQAITSNQARHIVNNNMAMYAMNAAYTNMMSDNFESYFDDGSFFGNIIGSMAGDERERQAYIRNTKSIMRMAAPSVMPLIDQMLGYDRGKGMNVLLGRSNYMLSGVVGDLGLADERGFIDANSKEMGERRRDLATSVYRGVYQNMYDKNGLKNYKFNFGLDETFMTRVMSDAIASGQLDRITDSEGNPILDKDGKVVSMRGGNGTTDWATYRESMVKPLMDSIKDEKAALEGDSNLKKYDEGVKSEKENIEDIKAKKKEYEDKLAKATTEEDRELYRAAIRKSDVDLEAAEERLKKMEESATTGREKVRTARGDDLNRTLARIAEETAKPTDTGKDSSLRKQIETLETQKKEKEKAGDRKGAEELDRSITDLRKQLAELNPGKIDTSEERDLREVATEVQNRITSLRESGNNEEADKLTGYLDELQAKIDEKQKAIDEVNEKVKEIDRPVREAFEKIGSSIAGSVDALKDIFGSTEEAYRQLKKMTGGNQFSESNARTVEMEIRELTNMAAIVGVDPKMAGRMLEANQTIYAAQRGMSSADIAAGYGDNAATNQQAIVQTLGLLQALSGKDAKERQELEVQSRFGADQKANSTMQRFYTQLEYARQEGQIDKDTYDEYLKELRSGNVQAWGKVKKRFYNKVYGSEEAGDRQLNDLAQIKYLEEQLTVESGINRAFNMNKSHKEQYADQLELSEAMENRKVAVEQMVASGITFDKRREAGARGQFDGIVGSLERSEKGDIAKNQQVARILKEVRQRALASGKSEAEANEAAMRAFQKYKGFLGEAGDEAETAGINGETEAYNEKLREKTDIKLSGDRSALSGVLRGVKTLKERDNLTVGDIGKIGSILFSDEVEEATGLRTTIKDYDKVRSRYFDAIRKGDMRGAYQILQDAVSKMSDDQKAGLGFFLGQGQFDQGRNQHSRLAAQSAAAKALTGKADVTTLKYFENLGIHNEEDVFKLINRKGEVDEQLFADLREGRLKTLQEQGEGDGAKLLRALASNSRKDWVEFLRNPNVSAEEFTNVSLKQFQEKVGETMTTFFENMDEGTKAIYGKKLGLSEEDSKDPNKLVRAYTDAAAAAVMADKEGVIDPNADNGPDGASSNSSGKGGEGGGAASGDKGVVATLSDAAEGVIKELIQAVKDLVTKLDSGPLRSSTDAMKPEETSSPGG